MPSGSSLRSLGFAKRGHRIGNAFDAQALERGHGTAEDGSANHRGLWTTLGKETESNQDSNAELP